MSQVRSVCPYCGVGCGVLVNVVRGRVASVKGDPVHPVNRGGLCSKGRYLTETVRTGDRLQEPMLRPGPGQPPVPVDWDRAIAAVAGGIKRSRETYGPDSVALYLSGQLLTEDYYVANKLGKGLLGTANVDTNSRLCMSSTVAAYKRSFGADGPPGCYEDLEAASQIWFWGSNAALTHPILYGRMLSARQGGGRRWIVVDPRRTPTADEADDHLSIRPGTDVALLQAMAGVMLREGLVKEAEVELTCSGLAEMSKTALAMPPERAAEICGLEPERIKTLARGFATSNATLSVWCQGFNQSSAGTDKINALINLHLLTGQIGRRGTGPFSLTGQANAMGGREVGGLATDLAAHHSLENPEDRAAVESFWGLGPVPAQRGLTAVELIGAIEESKVRVLWVVATNPMASLPDGQAAMAAFQKLDLLIVQELYHPTDTTRMADILLPAAGWAEKTGTLTNSERRVSLAEAAVSPPGQARPDWEIFAGVARALGGGDRFNWPDSAAVFDEHVALTRGRDLDMSGLSHSLLRELGPQQWPFPTGGSPSPRRYVDGVYATPDGKARLIAVEYRPPAEQPDQLYPLRLTTGRLRDHWHTMTRTGRVAVLRKEAAENTVHVNPADAQNAGVEDGQLALVTSPRGHLRARVHVTDRQLPGLLFMPFHRGSLLEPLGWTNVLPSRAIDPLSFQPELKHTVAWLGPAPTKVALTGGLLAEAIVRWLEGEGLSALLVTPEQLEMAPESVQKVSVGGAAMGGAVAWWTVASEPGDCPRPESETRAVVDLRHGPEPLSAVTGLLSAGWTVSRLGDGGLPPEILRLLQPTLPAIDPGQIGGGLVVGEPLPQPAVAVPQSLHLEPGGQLGL
ncbi:MAG TPA: nitrate reductase, partial [Candidatus Dormibacteraeota bacterium]|nr:nitrate reductase [Candidatus Dormibacteraeota bacterium]